MTNPTTAKPRLLQPVLRQRINRLAHSLGQRHELRTKAELMAKVQSAADAGARGTELDALVDGLEATLADS